MLSLHVIRYLPGFVLRGTPALCDITNGTLAGLSKKKDMMDFSSVVGSFIPTYCYESETLPNRILPYMGSESYERTVEGNIRWGGSSWGLVPLILNLLSLPPSKASANVNLY